MNQNKKYAIITLLFMILIVLFQPFDISFKIFAVIIFASSLIWICFIRYRFKSDKNLTEEDQIKQEILSCFDESGLRRSTYCTSSNWLRMYKDLLCDLDINNIDEWIQKYGSTIFLASKDSISNLDTINTFDSFFKEEDIFKFTQLVFRKMLDTLSHYDENENLTFLINENILQSLKTKHDTYLQKKLEYTYQNLSFPFFEFERIYRENQQDILYIYFRAVYDMQLTDNNYQIHSQKRIDKNYRFVFTRHYNEFTIPETYELNRSSLDPKQWFLERYGGY